MLRITNDEGARTLTLRLEGRLEGPWVAVLGQCWEGARRVSRGRRLCVDLKGVTFVDAPGRARLAEMYAQGAKFLAEDLETKAIVAEIESGRGGGGASRPDGNHGPRVNMSEQLTQLQRLQDELHEVNEDFAKAARPLERLSGMNEKERQKVADELRIRLARWESVTRQISQVLGTGAANGQAMPEGESR